MSDVSYLFAVRENDWETETEVVVGSLDAFVRYVESRPVHPHAAQTPALSKAQGVDLWTYKGYQAAIVPYAG